MRKPRHVIRAGGEKDSEPSNYCPKCGETSIESAIGETQVFDEDGWYYPITLTCKTPSCKHKWVEKFSVSRPSQRMM